MPNKRTKKTKAYTFIYGLLFEAPTVDEVHAKVEQYEIENRADKRALSYVVKES